MTINEATQLSNIYNTLLLVKTCGVDTRIMGKCLENLENFLMNASVVEEEIEINKNKED